MGTDGLGVQWLPAGSNEAETMIETLTGILGDGRTEYLIHLRNGHVVTGVPFSITITFNKEGDHIFGFVRVRKDDHTTLIDGSQIEMRQIRDYRR